MHYVIAMTEGGSALNIIQNTIHASQIGEGVTFKNLTMFPLFAGEAVESGYLTLDEALAADTAIFGNSGRHPFGDVGR